MLTEREINFLSEHFSGREFDDAVKAAEDGEPIAYLIGEWYFWKDTFKLNHDCLIPRSDTEHLVEHTLKRLPDNGYFADVCCGSGCIGLSVLKDKPDARAFLCDISNNALEAARENAERLGVSERCEFCCMDITKDFLSDEKSFDIILSNPPYVKTDIIDTLSAQVKREPNIALDGGADGMDFYRILTSRWMLNVRNGGYMILEIGYDQKEQIETLCDCRVYRDYGGNYRVAVINK